MMKTATGATRRASRALTTAVAMLVVAALAACGPNATISLVLSPASLTMFLGATETVTVTVTRSPEATADVSLSASGAPEWVTITFAPATLSGATVTSTMTIATDAGHPSAGPLDFTVSVAAVGAGLSTQAQLAVEVEQLDVTGTVLGVGGAAQMGLTVFISGHPPVVTASDGSFSFSAVSAPYDLTVADPVDGFSHTFVGLTTAAPTVRPLGLLLTAIGSGDYGATVTGSLQHGTLVPLPADHRAKVCVEGLAVVLVSACVSVAPGNSNYTLQPRWSGASIASVRLRAYVYEMDAEGEATAIVAGGTTAPFDLVDASAPVQDVTVNATASQAVVDSTTTVPSGYTLAQRGLIAHYTDFASIDVFPGTGTSLTRQLVAPFFTGTEYSALALATSNVPGSASISVAWSAGHVSGDSVALELPTPVVPVSPANGALDVTEDTLFTVVNASGGIATFVISPASSGPRFAITSSGTEARIPDLAAIGLALPAGTDYTWQVLASHDLTTANDAVTGAGYLGDYLSLAVAATGGGPGPLAAGRLSTSASSEFVSE